MKKGSLSLSILGMLSVIAIDFSYAQSRVDTRNTNFNKRIEAALNLDTLNFNLMEVPRSQLIAAYREVDHASRFKDVFSDREKFQVYVDSDAMKVEFLGRPLFGKIYVGNLDFLPDNTKDLIIHFRDLFEEEASNPKQSATLNPASSEETMALRGRQELEEFTDDYSLAREGNRVTSPPLSPRKLGMMFADIEYKYRALGERLCIESIEYPLVTQPVKEMLKDGKSLKETRDILRQAIQKKGIILKKENF